MEFHPFRGEVFGSLIPLDEVLLGDHINLSPFNRTGRTAVVMLAAFRSIVGHNKQSNGIGDLVSLDVVVIPFLAIRETGSVLALQQKPADLRYRRLLKLQGSEVVELENNP